MTIVAIAGGHGQIALHLTRLLTDRGVQVLSLVRNPDHDADITEAGGQTVVVDLEAASAEDLATVIAGADAVVFAAGAGGNSGAKRKETVDYGGAVKLQDACERADVDRYVMLSSMGTDDPPEVDPDDDDNVFAVYLQAKARADESLMASTLSWTVLRPGRLTDDDPTGRVSLARHVDRSEIPRADVADVLDRILAEPGSVGHILEVISGDTPVADAVAHL